MKLHPKLRVLGLSPPVRGVAALILSVLGGFVKILGDLTSYIGNWEGYEKSWVITSIMLGIGGFEENREEYYQSNWVLGVYGKFAVAQRILA